MNWNLDRIPTYGKLSDCTLEQARELLNLLADSGLVERQTLEGGKPGAFVLSLTEEGRRVMKAEARPDLPLPPRRSSSSRLGRRRETGGPADAGEADPKLVDRLRKWRLQESLRRDVPPYVVFHDKTLTAIAAARPRDRDALLRIKGLGPVKLAQYGDAVLEIVQAQE
jgi:ATP-dependent DNA helicase RecQ